MWDLRSRAINEATRLGLPVFLVSRMEDHRAQEWFKLSDVSAYDIAAVNNRFSEAKFILTNINMDEVYLILEKCPKAENFYVETTGQHIRDHE